MGGAFAQMRWQSDAIIGQTLKAVNSFDKDTLTVNFQSSKTACSSWTRAKATASLGKDSLTKVTCQTQKGIQVKAFLDNTTTAAAYENGSFKCNNAGSNGNPGRVASIDSLKNYLIKSIGTVTYPAINGSTSDSITRPAACLFNYGTGEIAFGMYPGKATKIEYIYRFDYTGKTCTDDISFDMWTYDAGTTGLTAVYELAVYKSSVADANLIGSKVNVYTTGNPLKTVNIAAETGVAFSEYTNKSMYIVVKTLGTPGTGIAHARDINNLPVNVDPTVVFDNFFMTYQTPIFLEPINTATNSNYLNYNYDAAPSVKTADAGMTNLGTATPITTGVTKPITITLKSTNRVGTFTVIESFAHNTNVTYALASAFKANDGSGNYSVPVACTETINGTTSMWTLTIAAPVAGTSVVDDMQFTYNVNKATDGNTQLRLEISNGSARFWYDFNFSASTATALDGKSISPIGISTSNSSISVINAKRDIEIYTLSGQKVALLNVNNAMNGVAVKAGAYIVKHGSEIHKVLVK